METYNDWLAHHGILGMKWGKKNGPPYPLSDDQMSAVEKRNNEVSEFAAKVKHESKLRKVQERENIDKEKMARRELVRQHKFEEKESRRQTRVQEREEHRQNRVDEREIRRQHRFDDAEQIRQNRIEEGEERRQDDFDSKETYEKYKNGKKYVTKALVGIGVTAVSLYAAYKIGNKATGGKLGDSVKSMFKKNSENPSLPMDFKPTRTETPEVVTAPVASPRVVNPTPAGSSSRFSSNAVKGSSWKTQPKAKFEQGKTYLRSKISGDPNRTMDFGKLNAAQRESAFKKSFGVGTKEFKEYMSKGSGTASSTASAARSITRGPVGLRSATAKNGAKSAFNALSDKTRAPESVRTFMPQNSTNWGRYSEATKKAITRMADNRAYSAAASEAAAASRGLTGQAWIKSYFSRVPRK